MSEAALRLLTVADAAAIACGLALMVGALASWCWLRQAPSAWARAVARLSRRWLVVGGLLALVAHAAAAWLQAAAMADEPSSAVGPMLWVVLRQTHFGRAWLVGLAALLLVLLAAASKASAAGGRIAALAIGAYALSRSVVSHAGGQGDYTVQVAVDGAHLLVVSLWVGLVLIGVLAAFRCPPKNHVDGVDALRWISLLSQAATAALVLIIVTGAVKVSWATPSWRLLVASVYGQRLLVKLAWVGIAVGLGGYNRWHAMPRLRQALGGSAEAPVWRRGRFAHVLRLEAAVLLCAVVAAAVLSGTATPGEG